MKQESLKFSGRASNPATKKFSPAQIAAQKLFAERARAGTLGKTVKRKTNPDLYSGAYAKAQKAALSAKDGSLKFGNDVYDFKFDKNEWVYKVTDRNGNYVVNVNEKSLSKAKSFLKDYLNNPISAPKRNPDKAKPRAYVKRASQATGAPPSKRLVTRRKKALTAPAGYFPNPEPSHGFARIGKPFAFDGRTWKVSQYSQNGKTIEAYTTDRKSPYRVEKISVSELEGYYGLAGMVSLSRKTNPMVKYTNRAKDMRGDQRVGYAVHMADRPSYQAIAWFTKKDDAVKVAQEASDRTGKQLAVTRVQNYFGAM